MNRQAIKAGYEAMETIDLVKESRGLSDHLLHLENNLDLAPPPGPGYTLEQFREKEFMLIVRPIMALDKLIQEGKIRKYHPNFHGRRALPWLWDQFVVSARLKIADDIIEQRLASMTEEQLRQLEQQARSAAQRRPAAASTPPTRPTQAEEQPDLL